MNQLESDNDPRLLITPERIRRLNAEDLLRSYSAKVRPSIPLSFMSIEGLLSFREKADFEFGRLNLLVGPNGSGKSNLISCIRLLRLSTLDIQTDFKENGFEEWLHRERAGENQNGSITAVAHPMKQPELLHQIVLSPAPYSRATLEERITRANDYKGDAPIYFAGSRETDAVILGGGSERRRRPRILANGEYDPSQSILVKEWDGTNYPELKALSDLYSDFRFYTEWTFGRKSVLRESVPAGEDSMRMSESLGNLPVVLRDLTDAEAIQKIRRLLEELKETYRDYLAGQEGPRVKTFIQEMPFDTPVPSGRLSDGTLRFLAMAAILLHPNLPALVCLDEPELGMHPDMIRIVGEMIADASKRAQIIVSTHSEHLLTALEDDFDCLFAFDANQEGSWVRRFGQAEFVEWRDDHRLGDLWTSGELGGNRW